MALAEDAAVKAALQLTDALTGDDGPYWVIMDAFAILAETKRLMGDKATAQHLGLVMERMAIARRSLRDLVRVEHGQRSADNG